LLPRSTCHQAPNHLSLAEVQVIGGELCSPKIKNWRFPEVDYSSAHNDFGGTTNAPNYPNMGAFAVLDHQVTGF
jgi:hypothetical protein